MNIQIQETSFDVRLIGQAALRVLSVAGQGTVLTSVTNTVYLLNQSGELCWVVPKDAPMHRRALKVVTQLPRLSAGINYQVVDHTLALNSEEILDFHQALIWKEPEISNKDVIPIARLSESLNLVAEQLLIHYRPSGLGCLIKPILQAANQHRSTLDTSFESRMAETAWLHLHGIIQALRGQDTNLVIHHVKSLLGLGEGLTPSGDDFLGGFFYSMLLLQRHYSATVKLPVSIYSDSILRLKPLTNLISYTILMDHTEGHSVEPLHQLTYGMLVGVPTHDLIDHAKRLISLGHSTGWDLLAGFFAGMAVAFIQ